MLEVETCSLPVMVGLFSLQQQQQQYQQGENQSEEDDEAEKLLKVIVCLTMYYVLPSDTYIFINIDGRKCISVMLVS